MMNKFTENENVNMNKTQSTRKNSSSNIMNEKRKTTRNKSVDEGVKNSKNSTRTNSTSTKNRTRSSSIKEESRVSEEKEQVSAKMKGAQSSNKRSKTENNNTVHNKNVNIATRRASKSGNLNQQKKKFTNIDNAEIVQYEIFNDDDMKDIEENEENVEEVENIVIQSKDGDRSKFDTVSIEEIREKLETRVNANQKRNTIKEALMNIGIAIVMVMYLIIVVMGSKNIGLITLEKDLKILTLSILFIGIIIFEMSYKKDNVKLSINGLEVVIFGMTNLVLMYNIKVSLNSLMSIASYISIGIGGYYLIKVIVLSKININRYRKDNSDIKEIIKK